MCDFQSLYFGEEGYVVCCRHCCYYQVAFGNTLLNLTALDFSILRQRIKYKCGEDDYALSENTKNVVVQTPSQNMFLLLTAREAIRFRNMIEEADNEAKALSLIDLFNN